MAVVRATDPAIRDAAARLREGGLVAFPTETVYGLGASALLPEACARVFDVKRRPRFDPLIVHVGAVGDLEPLCAGFDARAARLAEAFWPGPLTLVLPKTERVPDLVTAGEPTVAVRIPSHPVARALLREARVPIAAPSANPFGYVSPTNAEHVRAQLGDAVELILDGGACEVGIESTIVDLSSGQARILREGGVERERIEAILGALPPVEEAVPARAPGQLPSHYAPRVPLSLVDAAPLAPARDAGLLAVTPPGDAVRASYAVVEVLAPDGSLRVAAANLFAALRRLDASGVSRIVAVRPPAAGLGAAILDRLTRASRR